MSVTPRLNRLFSLGGTCLSVALDRRGLSTATCPSGMDDMHGLVDAMVDAYPDAIHLPADQAPLLQNRVGKMKPALIMRADLTSLDSTMRARPPRSRLIHNPIQHALALEAACVVVSLRLWPDQPDLYHQCIANVRRLKPDCVTYGMPLMLEVVAMRSHDAEDDFAVDGDIAKIAPLVREGVELGADIISPVPCDNVEDFHQVIEAAAGKPVLPQVGGMASAYEILSLASALMQQGATGLVYTLDGTEHPYPQRMAQALIAVVRDGAKVEHALPLTRPLPYGPYSGQVMS